VIGHRCAQIAMAVLAAIVPVAMGASPAPVGRICFEHIGLQGKPMPEFCVATRPATESPPHEVVLVSEPALARIVSICTAPEGPVTPMGPGYYRWFSDSTHGSTQGVVGPGDMRAIVAELRSDMRLRGTAVPDIVERLASRLRG
jgi:hypothetical protein